MDTPGGSQPFRQLRRSTGISLRELEQLTKINRGRLSIIERGVMPTPEEAAKIVAALFPKGEVA